MTTFEPEFVNRKSDQQNSSSVSSANSKNERKIESDKAEAKIQDELKAGTGFMQSLSEAITHFQAKGYKENIICCVDHFRSQCRKVKVFPSEINVMDVQRFENSSDPDDQSILYVISVPSKNIKGLYIESYGLYHEDQSDELRKALRLCR